ncbi:putative secreted glycosidase [Podosphaera aphanis]|nr:putative secreted glycosidase [Podosphaera aphanis]
MSFRRLFSLFLISKVYGSSKDVLKYVDPLIGSSNQGNVFAGATLPYGMAKAVADSTSGFNQGGFTTDSINISGFSSMHDSGTGGSASLGNFALFAYKGCTGDDINGCTYPKKFRKTPYVKSSVKSSPGYFGLELESGVNVDMTVTHHTSLFRFRFPSNSTESPLILMDLTDLSNSRQDNTTVTVHPESGRMTGHAKFNPSFGIGNYIAYFCADFSGSALRDNGVFVNTRASVDFKDLDLPSTAYSNNPLPAGAFNRFAPGSETVLARVGISLISSEQACSSAEKEIPEFDFESVQTAAEEIWRKKLSPIEIDSTDVEETYLTNFYSGIYRSMVNPQDYTGENPLWDSDEPYFDSFYCLWDTFRSQIPFLIILDPESVALQVRSLIDTYKHEGFLPECRMSLCKGFTQGGSSADIVLADAYLKGVTDGIDWEIGYEAVVKDAEVEPHNWCCEGRGGLDSWKTLGYIPAKDFDHRGFGLMISSISRTLEYSYNDFSIAQLGRALGKMTDVEKYIERSGNWKNLFKDDQTSYINYRDPSTNEISLKDTGFVGFFQPRNLNQTFSFQDPLTCSNLDHNPDRVCNLDPDALETYESSIWEYSFFVPHDHATLITKLGGPKSFVDRLNYLHDNGINYIGDEPSYLTVFQYHYAGRPALSASRSHYYIPSFLQPTHGGLPGNDDSGAMGTFVAFAMIGLFPNPGQDVYLITPPFFKSVSITSTVTGKTARISNMNFDPTYKNISIQSATLDGEPYTKNWIDHSFFTEGKELVLVLGSQESSWGTRVEDLPPSLGTYDGFDDISISNKNVTTQSSRIFSSMLTSS